MSIDLEISTAAVLSGQLDRSCRVRDVESGEYEFFHPRLMTQERQAQLQRALELVQKNPDWPQRTMFHDQPRSYVVPESALSSRAA